MPKAPEFRKPSLPEGQLPGHLPEAQREQLARNGAEAPGGERQQSPREAARARMKSAYDQMTRGKDDREEEEEDELDEFDDEEEGWDDEEEEGEDSEEEDEEDLDDDEQEDDDELDGSHEEAVRALLDSGFTMREITAMGEQEATRRGLERARAMTPPRRNDRQAGSGDDQDNEPGEGKRGARPSEGALKPPDFKKLLGTYAEQTGMEEDHVAGLAKVFEDVTKPLYEGLARSEERERDRARESGRRMIDQAKRELGKRIPELKDSRNDKALLRRVAVLSKDDSIGDPNASRAENVRALVKAAASSLGWSEKGKAERKEGRRRTSRARRTASSTRPRQKPSQQAPPTRKAQMEVAYRHLLKHPQDIDGARRVAGIKT